MRKLSLELSILFKANILIHVELKPLESLIIIFIYFTIFQISYMFDAQYFLIFNSINIIYI